MRTHLDGAVQSIRQIEGDLGREGMGEDGSL